MSGTAQIRLEPMTQDEYADYREKAEQSYVQQIVTSGLLPLPEAQRKAVEDYARLLPDGLTTKGHHLWTAYDGDDRVGLVWLHLEERSDGRHAFGYDFEVGEELRRRGYGRAVIQAVEERCRELEVVEIGLNVFGSNAGARQLYEQVGFEVTSLVMRKRLVSEPPNPR